MQIQNERLWRWTCDKIKPDNLQKIKLREKVYPILQAMYDLNFYRACFNLYDDTGFKLEMVYKEEEQIIARKQGRLLLSQLLGGKL